MNRENTSKEGRFPPVIPPSTIQISSPSEVHPVYSNSSSSTSTSSPVISRPSADAINLAVELLNSLASCQRDGLPGSQQPQAHGYHTTETGLQTLSNHLIALATAANGPPEAPLSSPLLTMPIAANGQHALSKGDNPAVSSGSAANQTAVARELIDLLSAVSNRPSRLADSSLTQVNSWNSRLPSAGSPGSVTAFQNALSQLALLGLSSPSPPGARSLGVRSCKRSSSGSESQLGLPLGSGSPSALGAGLARFPLRSDGTKVMEVELSNHNGQCQPMDVTESNAVYSSNELVGSKVIIRQTADADDHFFKALRRLKVDASPELKQIESKKSLEQTVIPAPLGSKQQVLADDGRSAAELAVDEHFKKSLAAFRASSHPVPSPSASSSSSLASAASVHANPSKTSSPCTVQPITSLSSNSPELSSTAQNILLKTISASLFNTSATVSAPNNIARLKPNLALNYVTEDSVNSNSHKLEVPYDWSRSTATTVVVTDADKKANIRTGDKPFTKEKPTNIIESEFEKLLQDAHPDNETVTTRRQSMSTSPGLDNAIGVVHINLDKKSAASSPGGQASLAHSFKPKKNWLAQYDVRQGGRHYQLVDAQLPTDSIGQPNPNLDSHESYVGGTDPRTSHVPQPQTVIFATTAQQIALTTDPHWSHVDMGEAAVVCTSADKNDTNHCTENRTSPPASPTSSSCSPLSNSGRSSDFELDVTPTVLGHCGPQKQSAQHHTVLQHLNPAPPCCPGDHNADCSGAGQWPRQRCRRHTHRTSAAVTQTGDTSPSASHPRARRNKKTADSSSGSEEGGHKLLAPTKNTKSVATGSSPERDHLIGCGSEGGHQISSVNTGSSAKDTVSSSLEDDPPIVITCGDIYTSFDEKANKVTQQSNSETCHSRTIEIKGKNKPSSGSARVNDLAVGAAEPSPSNSSSASYWTRLRTSPPQSFSSSPSPVRRESTATTAVTPISGITSGFFSGSTYSLDSSSWGAANLIAFDSSIETKSTTSSNDSKVPIPHGIIPQCKDSRSQNITNHGANYNLTEDDDECMEFHHRKSQPHNQTNCVWRKRASSEVSPWSTLKRSRSVITSSSSSGEHCDSCDSPSRARLADDGRSLLPATSTLLITSSRHSMSELTCPSNHIGRSITSPDFAAPPRLSGRDGSGYSHGHLSEAGGQLEDKMESFDRQLLSSSYCCIRQDSRQLKIKSAPSAISASHTPPTTAAVSISRSLSDATSLSAFHLSHEEPVYMLR